MRFDLSFFITLVSSFGVLAGYCKLNNKANLSKEERHKQFAMPIVSLVYVIVQMIFINGLYVKLLSLIEYLASFATMIPLIGPYIGKLSNLVSLDSGKAWLLNITLFSLYLTAKKIVLPILSKIWENPEIATYTSEYFYDFDSENDLFFVKKHLSNVREYVKGFYYGLIATSAIVFTFSIKNPTSILFKGAFYPVMVIIVMSEFYYYLDGYTKEEYLGTIYGEDDDAISIANYGMLRKILVEIFPERHLTNVVMAGGDDVSESHDLLEKLINSEDDNEKLVGDYFNEFKLNGNNIDINYVHSCLDLMNGKSTVVLNPFYKDFGEYLILPLIKTLINYGKCLVIVGRDSISLEVKNWLNELIISHIGTKSLWKCDLLDEEEKELDIGITRFSDIYNLDIQNVNRDFLKEVTFVLILEPSRIISSAQVGLNILANQLSTKEKITYLVCDRSCDGLVDTLSHVFMCNMTEVTSALNPADNTTQMFFKADGEYMHYRIINGISRYLGNGTELSLIALKYQLSNAKWLSDSKFPVRDIKWIDGQYYKQLCEYANLPSLQEAFNDLFDVDSNIWNVKKRKYTYLTVEDEFRNMFEVSKLYSSRGEKQSFINVISENYLLRDYMVDNSKIFVNDPKMIPTIVADYARSERNVILKLIMIMGSKKLYEEDIRRELMLCGINVEGDVIDKFKSLIIKHCNYEEVNVDVEFIEGFDESSFTPTVSKTYYFSKTNPFYKYCEFLGNAYYIAEDETDRKHYITAKLYCHVFQDLLPGQFMCYDGKYYEVQSITSENGVIVRRAADHIDNRHYYQQIRNYYIDDFTDAEEMGTKQSINNIETVFGFANIKVSTSGYYDMLEYGDFKHARRVDLNGIPDRVYKHKLVLKIKLPDASDKVIYTISTLFNEIFRTIYPNDYQYVQVVSKLGEEVENRHICMVDGEIENGTMYVIEDSEIDLGLLISVRRNLEKLLYLTNDYLKWHKEKLLETKMKEEPDDDNGTIQIPELPQKEETENIFKSIGSKIKSFFGRIFKKKNTKDESNENDEVEVSNHELEDQTDNQEEDNAITQEDSIEEDPSTNDTKESNEEDSDENQDESNENDEVEVSNHELEDQTDNQEDIKDNTDSNEEDDGQILMSKLVPIDEPTEYQLHGFMKYGEDTFDSTLGIDETIEFIDGLELGENMFTNARFAEKNPQNSYEANKEGIHYCDFCGIELAGGEYEITSDGRERCNRCSRTAIRNEDEFKKIYKNALQNMEVFFGVHISAKVAVKMVSAKKIAKMTNSKFEATPGFDARTLGFAKKEKDLYELYIENGAPKLVAIATIVHELTHIWQYQNWKDKDIVDKYGKASKLIIYEGMAKWAEIQYLYLINEKNYAYRQEANTIQRNDEYGLGFNLYKEHYRISHDVTAIDTPFKHKYPIGKD